MSITEPVQIAGIGFYNKLMNGAYIRSKTLEDVQNLAESRSGAVVVGSITVQPRKQNAGEGYWLHDKHFYSLNSYGLPNGGLPYFRYKLPEMAKIAHAYNKPLIANLVGFSPEEFVTLIRFAQVAGADIAELNLGCPNIWDRGQQKSIISYHPTQIRELLDSIIKQKFKIKLAVKISPLPPDLLQVVASVIADSHIIQLVTATNSYPNAAVSTGTTTFSNQHGTLAGLAGQALKPISLGVVAQLRQWLPKSIAIIGCGGISSVNDVNDYLTAGADVVQIASALVDQGPRVFKTILKEEVNERTVK